MIGWLPQTASPRSLIIWTAPWTTFLAARTTRGAIGRSTDERANDPPWNIGEQQRNLSAPKKEAKKKALKSWLAANIIAILALIVSVVSVLISALRE
jgi:hypothetical protein